MELKQFKYVAVNYIKPDGTIQATWIANGRPGRCRVVMSELLQFYQDNPATWYVEILTGESVSVKPVGTLPFDEIIVKAEYLEVFLKAFIIKNYYGKN